MTMAATAGRDDPFRDPSLVPKHTAQPGDAAGVPDTLAVGRDASLTLGTDSLVVLGVYEHMIYMLFS
jgi:sphingosine kinase